MPRSAVPTHCTLMSDGRCVISTRYLDQFGLKAPNYLNFEVSSSGHRITLTFGGGKVRINNGAFRIGTRKGFDIIRAIEDDKPKDYPYKYKGIYVLECVGTNKFVGRLAKEFIPGVKVNE